MARWSNRRSMVRGCGLPVRGYKGASPTPPFGANQGAPAAAGRLISAQQAHDLVSQITISGVNRPFQ